MKEPLFKMISCQDYPSGSGALDEKIWNSRLTYLEKELGYPPLSKMFGEYSHQKDRFRCRINDGEIRIEASLPVEPPSGRIDYYDCFYKNEGGSDMLENMEHFLNHKIKTVSKDGLLLPGRYSFFYSLKEAIGRPEIDSATSFLIDEALKYSEPLVGYYAGINPLVFEADKSLGGIAEAVRVIINVDERVKVKGVKRREYLINLEKLTNPADFGVTIDIERREQPENSIKPGGELKKYLTKTVKTSYSKELELCAKEAGITVKRGLVFREEIELTGDVSQFKRAGLL